MEADNSRNQTQPESVCPFMRCIYTLIVSFSLVGSLSLPAVTAMTSEPNFPAPSDSIAVGAPEVVIDGLDEVGGGFFMASDPDLTKIGDTWFMFFTSIDAATQKLHILAATLPAGEPLSADVSDWSIMRFPDGKPISILSPGANEKDWDRDAVETAKFIRGYDNSKNEWVHRIYYTGWRTLKSKKKNYGIGMAEWNGSTYVKHPDAVLKGTHPWERFQGESLVGDQSLIYIPGPGPDGAGGTWHMYYQANSLEPAPGVRTVHAQSADGIHWPPEQRELLDTTPPFPEPDVPSGPYFADVRMMDGKYVLIGWVPSRADHLKQGLWMTSSSTPSGFEPSDFSEWKPLLYGYEGLPFNQKYSRKDARKHELGLFGATMEQDDDGIYWLFFHSVSKRQGHAWADIQRVELDL